MQKRGTVGALLFCVAYLPRRSRLEPSPFFFAFPSPLLARERAAPPAPRPREGLDPRDPRCPFTGEDDRGRGRTGWTCGGGQQARGVWTRACTRAAVSNSYNGIKKKMLEKGLRRKKESTVSGVQGPYMY